MAKLSQQHILIVGDDADRGTLNLINNQPVDPSGVSLPKFFIAQDETKNIAGVDLSCMPDAIGSIKQHLFKPKLLDAELIAKIEGLLQPLSSGIVDTRNNLHNFLEEHQGKLIICVSA